MSREVMRDEFVSLNLVGNTPVFVAALKKLKKTARFDAPVMIRGETGTGKEVAARAIHYLSDRSEHPFIPVDCGAIPDSLVENELFGHERGAYTDARQSQRGLVAQAEGGTLFLDEIDALSGKAQVALLRFLQTGEYRSLGSQVSLSSDVRVITATNANLEALVSAGEFRQDLFFRIDVLSVELPPLRDRAEDIALLAAHFISAYSQQYEQPQVALHQDTLAWMLVYEWPGNVRELENFIHRELLMCENSIISSQRGVSSAPAQSDIHCGTAHLDIAMDISLKEAKAKLIEQFEQIYLRSLMQQSCGNVSLAARMAGQERRALGKLLRKHGIEKEDYQGL